MEGFCCFLYMPAKLNEKSYSDSVEHVHRSAADHERVGALLPLSLPPVLPALPREETARYF